MDKIKLTEAEWKIMSLLWDSEPMTVAQITAALYGETKWGRNTVINLLKRMEDKGAVGILSGVKPLTYKALYKREDAAVYETESFLGRIYKGSVGLMVNSLIKQNALSDDEIAELRKIIDSAKGDKNV